MCVTMETMSILLYPYYMGNVAQRLKAESIFDPISFALWWFTVSYLYRHHRERNILHVAHHAH